LRMPLGRRSSSLLLPDFFRSGMARRCSQRVSRNRSAEPPPSSVRRLRANRNTSMDTVFWRRLTAGWAISARRSSLRPKSAIIPATIRKRRFSLPGRRQNCKEARSTGNVRKTSSIINHKAGNSVATSIMTRKEPMKKTVCTGFAAIILATMSPNFTAAQANEDKTDFNRAEIETIVRDYLLSNPEIMLDVQAALQEKQREAQQKALLETIEVASDELFHSENDGVIGNPDGDVTVVE